MKGRGDIGRAEMENSDVVAFEDRRRDQQAEQLEQVRARMPRNARHRRIYAGRHCGLAMRLRVIHR